MLEVSNSTAQVLAPGQALTFNAVLMKSGCAEAHRTNSSIVTLKADHGIYELHFGGNVTKTVAGQAQLAINLDGEPLVETTMISTIATVGNFNNVSAATLVKTGCGCCGRVTVTNVGTTEVTVGANASLFVKRIA